MGNDSPHLSRILNFNLQMKMPKWQIEIRNGTVEHSPAAGPPGAPPPERPLRSPEAALPRAVCGALAARGHRQALPLLRKVLQHRSQVRIRDYRD